MKQKLLKILYKFLAFCARIYLWRTKPFVIGITGSVGKTCCRDVITQVLEQVQDTRVIYTSPKNYNSELGLIFSIFRIESYNPSFKNLLKISWDIFKKSLLGKKKHDILVAEYGIDAPGDMDFLLGIMKPDIAIITKLDYVHSDNFPTGVNQYDTRRAHYDFNFNLQPGRFSIFQSDENIFIDSSYNAGPESMKKVIENTKLVQSELYPHHKIIYVL